MTNFEFGELMNTGEAMLEHETYIITKLPPLGEGLGTIGVESRLDNPDDGLTHEHLDIVDQEIRDPANMVYAEPNTDGCPDGRGFKKFFNLDENVKNFFRQKVFGGGQTMVMAGLVGAGKATGHKLKEAFGKALSVLSEKKIDFGAHTADHKNEDESGCGAIDKAINSWELSIKDDQKNKITQTIQALAGDTDDSLLPVINSTFGNIEATVPGFDKKTYSGAKVVDGAIKRGKIVAELGKSHYEVAIVINTDVEDKTFDQSKIREKTGDKAQVFAWDIPRMRKLATEAFDTPKERQQAFISMFVFSIATATILTKNDLPIYLISKTENPAIDFNFN
jgi:hypothetical protein